MRPFMRSLRISIATLSLPAILATPSIVPAEDFEEDFAPPWDQSTYSVDFTPPAFAYAFAQNNGAMRGFAESFGVESGAARAGCKHYYTYTHDTGLPVSFEFGFQLTGAMAYAGSGVDNQLTVYTAIWEEGVPESLRYCEGLSIERHIGAFDQEHTFTFTTELEQNTTYAVWLFLNVRAAGTGAGSAVVDISDHQGNGYGMLWDRLKVYHWESTTTTSDGDFSGVRVDAELQVLEQNQFPEGADSISLVSFSNPGDNEILDWSLTFNKFSASSSARLDARSVEAFAWGDTIALDESIRLKVSHWLAEDDVHCPNTIQFRDVSWHAVGGSPRGRTAAPAIPDHGWAFDWPEPWPELGANWFGHELTLYNASVQTLFISDLHFQADGELHAELTGIEFGDSQQFDGFDPLGPPLDFETIGEPFAITPLPPGGTVSVRAPTSGTWQGRNIYFRYTLSDGYGGGNELATVWGRHEVLTTTGVETGDAVPETATIRLSQNHPNPFNPSTHIRFHLDKPAWVTVKILGVDGRLVDVLSAGAREAGDHELTWNGADAEGRRAASGVYLCRVESAQDMAIGKMVLID